MSEATLYQKLPLLVPGQTLKHITHNEALQTLDVLLHCAVNDINVQTLPENPAAQTRVIISENPSETLTDKAKTLASYDGLGWIFRHPVTGWRIYDKTSGTSYIFDGVNWGPDAAASIDFDEPLNNLTGLGIGAEADATNVLSVNGPASLFDSASSHRLHINRNNLDETASLVFDTAYSGRAEIGLTGTGQDTLAVKVSEDGQSWKTALSIDPTGGIETGPVRSGVLVIGKDTVQSFTPPVDHGILILTTKFNAYPKIESSAILAFDVGGSPQLVTLALGPKASNVDTNVPDGTTGSNGFLTFGVSANNIHVENRVGPLAEVRYLIIG